MIRLTLFRATLVQDSALSVSSIDRENISNRPFTVVDGVPVLSGRGLKGAAVAMARRFFNPLPRSVSEVATQKRPPRRSAWEFLNARPETDGVETVLRAGVGILQKTGARASHVLHDREVVPAGTRWSLIIRVNWRYADNEAEEAEGILGYVLSEHWEHGRCWLGGDVVRGLGWCHIENLRAWRLNEADYERWVQSIRDLDALPEPLETIPTVKPTRSWCFRTLDVRITFGEYQPDPAGPAWGLDMLAIGSHDIERTVQPMGTGCWAKPSWAQTDDPVPEALTTDRSVLMEQGRPLLPGSSLRGPMRHAFSRMMRENGCKVEDPHLVQGNVGEDDPAGRIFGTVNRSSRVLICDAHARDGWVAARLHQHAEDEFSAGSYKNAKRDAVRVLHGEFPVRIVVEGPDDATVRPLMEELDRIVALGARGHLPLGGHKTRGAGWGRWTSSSWQEMDVVKARDWEPLPENYTALSHRGRRGEDQLIDPERVERTKETVLIRRTAGVLDGVELKLGEAAEIAQKILKAPLIAWWCEPTIDLSVTDAPVTFGRKWPLGNELLVDEVVFFARKGCWHAARTASGVRSVLIEEVAENTEGASQVTLRRTPAWLHGGSNRARFAQAAALPNERVVLREWHQDDRLIGFTLEEGKL